LNSFDSLAFALICDWVKGSWSFTFKALTSSGYFAVSVIGWAGLAFVVDRVEPVGFTTSDAVVVDFDESLWTAGLDLEIVPTWIWIGECSGASFCVPGGVLSKGASQDSENKNCFQELRSHRKVNF
jgi:hypothetical protein